MQIVGGGIAVAVSDDGLNMLHQLRDNGVAQIKALSAKSAKDQLAREIALDFCLGKSSLKYGAHDVSHIFASDACG
jgi:hypothetical protein